MPKGLLSRLIVRLNHLVKDLAKAWKKGVTLEWRETYAEVKEIYINNEIAIRVKGPQRKTLMGRIAEELDRLHATYEHINVVKKIPCNCTTCALLEVPHFYDCEEDLLIRVQHRKKTIECLMKIMLLKNTRMLA